jgi:DNA-binding transcriptional regulator GbsR (MarR family)
MRQEEADVVESFGLFFGQWGLPRMAGRALGWLMICDPPHQSADELAEALQASRGSISSATTMLVQASLAERYALPGDRRLYYRMRGDAWTRSMRAREAAMAEMRKLAEQGLDALADRPPQVRERLEDMRGLIAYLEVEFPALLDRWEEERGRR